MYDPYLMVIRMLPTIRNLLNFIYLYFSTFQINDFETIKVRAVLFQKSQEKLNAEIPPTGWEKRFYQPIFSEEAAGKQY